MAYQVYKEIVELENNFEAKKPHPMGEGRLDQPRRFFRSAFNSPVLKLDSMDSMKSGSFRQIYIPDNFVFAQGGGKNVWDKDCHTGKAELADTVLDGVWRETKPWECFQERQLV